MPGSFPCLSECRGRIIRPGTGQGRPLDTSLRGTQARGVGAGRSGGVEQEYLYEPITGFVYKVCVCVWGGAQGVCVC